MRLTRGFTNIDLVVVLGVVGLVAAVLLILQPAMRGTGCGRRDMKDAIQVRGIQQAMVVWGQSNNDEYPLPSRIDNSNSTVADEGSAKDTSANIYSLMIFTGSLSPELLVSPLETSPNVQACDGYQYEAPVAAIDPSKALWDPAFSAALGGPHPGNVSYAHLQPSGGRLGRFKIGPGGSTASEPVVGTRGPEIASVQKKPDGSVTPTLANPKSNTLLFFGKNKSWSGNMAFNDNHVEILVGWLKPGRPFKHLGRTYTAADGKQWPDLWCYDEPDDPKAANDYLGIFLKAGAEPKDFKAAWD